MENCILIDWFSFTIRNYNSIFDVINLLGFSDIEFQEAKYGFYGYMKRIFFDGVHIMWNHATESGDPQQDKFVLVEMTGQGCRDFDTYSSMNWDLLFAMVLDNPDVFHVTRLDVAYDDHADVFDINKILKDTNKRNYVCRCNKFRHINDGTRNSDAISITFGSHSSDFYIRIYDKARERGFHNQHWVRLECCFKQDRAFTFLKNPLPLGEKLRGVIYNYLRFVIPSEDTNKSRWQIRKYWLNFLGSCEKVSIYTKKDVDYNLSRLGNYVFGQAGNSIDTYIKCQGFINFLDNLLKRQSRLTVHQRSLIQQYVKDMESHIFNNDDFINSLGDVYKL